MRVSGQFYFLNEKISHAQKAQKSTKRTSDFHLDVLYAHKKHKKHKMSNKRLSS